MMQNNNFNLIKLLKKNKFKIKRLDYEKIVNSKQDLVDINYENLKQTDLFCFK